MIIMKTKKNSRTMNVVLWALQILLAVTFVWAGTMKLFQADELPWSWVQENPGLVIFSGIIDFLAGFGLTLPSLLRILPKLTVYASYGTIALMICASVFHIIRGEGDQIGFNIFILTTAIFIAWGRLKYLPIESK